MCFKGQLAVETNVTKGLVSETGGKCRGEELLQDGYARFLDFDKIFWSSIEPPCATSRANVLSALEAGSSTVTAERRRAFTHHRAKPGMQNMGLLPKNENTHSLIVREGWLGAETINESINRHLFIEHV